jgi:hypothetical protein
MSKYQEPDEYEPQSNNLLILANLILEHDRKKFRWSLRLIGLTRLFLILALWLVFLMNVSVLEHKIIFAASIALVIIYFILEWKVFGSYLWWWRR